MAIVSWSPRAATSSSTVFWSLSAWGERQQTSRRAPQAYTHREGERERGGGHTHTHTHTHTRARARSHARHTHQEGDTHTRAHARQSASRLWATGYVLTWVVCSCAFPRLAEPATAHRETKWRRDRQRHRQRPRQRTSESIARVYSVAQRASEFVARVYSVAQSPCLGWAKVSEHARGGAPCRPGGSGSWSRGYAAPEGVRAKRRPARET